MLKVMKIKRYNNFLLACSALLMLFVLTPQTCSADYDYIKISDPFLNKIPLAVPFFKNLSDDTTDTAGKDIAVTASNLVYNALSFTGYFLIKDCNSTDASLYLAEE